MERKLPWHETDRYTEQRRFIERWLEGGVTVSALCGQFGISRKTAYKRIRRYLAFGFDGLGDRSRAPRSIPHKTPAEVEQLLIDARLKYRYGPKKLLDIVLNESPGLDLPALSTIGDILKRAGLVRPRRRVRRKSQAWADPLTRSDVPGEVWCADLKGWFNTGDGMRCDPFTLTDYASRYLLACRPVTSPWHAGVRKEMERVFREHGLPQAIRTDNGAPFASTGLGGLTTLSAWWVKLGIVPERIERGHPEQNGRHERMHRTLKEATASPPSASARAQQKTFDRFRDEFNNQRPHEALGQKRPAEVHRPSPRQYPSRIREPGYPDDAQVRKVRTNGEIKWRGGMVFVSGALCGEPVGLRQEDEHHWGILFGPLHIGLLDERDNKVLHTPVKVLPMCPV